MKYIDWMRRRINSLADTKIIDFPETLDMIERKVRAEQNRQKRKVKHMAKRKGKIDHRTNRPGKSK
tara:strand:+ start:930 stop:1127 length:198 start_codon:yes stop_codon:yes gene_type:complete